MDCCKPYLNEVIFCYTFLVPKRVSNEVGRLSQKPSASYCLQWELYLRQVYEIKIGNLISLGDLIDISLIFDINHDRIGF